MNTAGAQERAEMIHIAGRVQGVGFRASAQHLALQYGVRGWVANVGRAVVIHACGPAERLELFVRALSEDIGPPARIDRMEREPADVVPRGASFRDRADRHAALGPWFTITPLSPTE